MYRPTSYTFWQGRIDTEDGDAGTRWHQVIECIDLEKEQLPELGDNMKGYAILGFRSDQGVVRNFGRAGASEGPEAIRKACINFACHFDRKTVRLIDCGDVFSEGTGLSAAQRMLGEMLRLIVDSGYFPLILGGGHEVSFGGYQGVALAERFKKLTVGVLNFDAHFDLREIRDHGTSGTPFTQIAGLCESNKKSFHYMCLGIQTHSNTEALFRKANELKAQYILAEDFHEQNLPDISYTLEKFLNGGGPLYLTVDMDVFDVRDAPGVSAPAVAGVDKLFMLKILRMVLSSGKIAAFDIAETNPKYDSDNRTAKLAAYLLYLVVGA